MGSGGVVWALFCGMTVFRRSLTPPSSAEVPSVDGLFVLDEQDKRDKAAGVWSPTGTARTSAGVGS